MKTEHKRKISYQNFLDWIFSDRDDYVRYGGLLKDAFKNNPKSSVTIDDLFRETVEFPKWLLDDFDESEEDADEWVSNVELIY